MSDVAPAAPWIGRLQLGFTWNQGRTSPVQPFVQAPLAVSLPFYPDGPATCHVMILHNAGGMVAGDRIELAADVGDGARAVLTTASAGKIYRSSGARTAQSVRFQVGEGAGLAWVPQETIVFDGADYRQDLTVDLAPEATYLGWDLVRFGRTARGERFASGTYRAHTTISRGGRPLWIDRQLMHGSEAVLTSEQGLAGCSVVGTLVWVGQPLDAALVEQARAAWAALATKGEAGVTAVSAGLVCRYRGESTADARRWFASVWALISAASVPAAGGSLGELPACTRLR